MKTSELTSARPAMVKAKVAPGPRGTFLFGSLSEMRSDALGLLSNAARDYGNIVRLRMVVQMNFLNHPDYIQHVLQSHHTNFKKDMMYERMKPLVGEGLLTSDGDFWRRQRRLSQPAFHKQRLAGFASTMADNTATMLDGWHEAAKSGQPIDVAAEMMKLALGIVGKTLFSVDLLGEAEEVGKALTVALEVTNERFQQLFLCEHMPTRQNRRFNKALKTLDRVVNGVIATRRGSGEDTGDLLSMLMAARDEATGEGMSDAQLRDEVMTLFLAGHETTANLMAWAWYLLSKNPTVERRLHEEVATVLSGRVPTLADLPNLKYTMMVIEETMRLYPPAWLFSREAIEEDEIGGYRIPKGGIVMLSPFVTHRHPDFWENPEGFDPERFTAPKVKERPRYAYFPFAGGPRQCIGNNFALMEAQIILAMVVQRYRLHLVPAQKIEPVPSVTLRPSVGIQVKLKPQVAA
ncbi:MAG: cytochrome P450 [Myxococcales bacterium]|nr:cytochrome P450 [Myxococcales bacterium]